MFLILIEYKNRIIIGNKKDLLLYLEIDINV